MDQFINLVSELPWQIGLLLCVVWVATLSSAVRRRERAVPLTMVESLIVDFKAHRKLLHDHGELLVNHEGRAVVLERRQVNMDAQAALNTAEHKELLTKLGEISERVARVVALQEKANGK